MQFDPKPLPTMEDDLNTLALINVTIRDLGHPVLDDRDMLAFVALQQEGKVWA